MTLKMWSAVLFAFVVCPMVWWATSGRRPVRSWTSRATESVALALIGVVAVMLVVTYSLIWQPEWSLPDATPELKSGYLRIGAVGIGLVLIVGVKAATGYALPAIVLLALSFGVGWHTIQHDREKFLVEATEEFEARPIPAEIRLLGHIDGADVWLNGVYVGKTPIKTSLDELLARFPDRNLGQFTQIERQGVERIADAPSHDTFYPARRFRIADQNVTVWIDRNGEHGVLAGDGFRFAGTRGEGGRKSLSSRETEPFGLLLNATFPSWEQDIKSLLDRARLNDYEFDAEWIQAMASYRWRGWIKLRQLASHEREFKRALTEWTRWQYDLDSVDDAHSAWQIVQRVSTEADRQGGYDTDTPAGQAIRLVIERLDPQQIVEAALAATRTMYRNPSERSRANTIDGEYHFFTLPRHKWRTYLYALEPHHAVLADMVWKLDQSLDAQDESVDNIIERRLVPELMRRTGRSGPRDFAEPVRILGGSMYERFQQRQDWRTLGEAKIYRRTPMEGPKFIVHENPSFMRLANLRSPTGRQFRQAHSQRLMNRAEEMVAAGFYYDRKELEFLFLNAGSGPPIGVDFWHRLYGNLRDVPDAPGNDVPMEVGLRVMFLKRLGKHVTFDMIVSTADLAAQGQEMTSLHLLLRELPMPQRFDVTLRVVEHLQRMPELPGVRSWDQPSQLATGLASTFRLLDHPDAARRAWKLYDGFERQRLRDTIGRGLEYDRTFKLGRLSAEFLSVMGHSDDPEIRRMLAVHLKENFVPSRRGILEILQSDTDVDVAAAARASRQYHNELKHSPLPSTGLEPVPFW